MNRNFLIRYSCYGSVVKEKNPLQHKNRLSMVLWLDLSVNKEVDGKSIVTLISRMAKKNVPFHFLYENIVVRASSLHVQTGGPHHNFLSFVVTNYSGGNVPPVSCRQFGNASETAAYPYLRFHGRLMYSMVCKIHQTNLEIFEMRESKHRHPKDEKLCKIIGMRHEKR